MPIIKDERMKYIILPLLRYLKSLENVGTPTRSKQHHPSHRGRFQFWGWRRWAFNMGRMVGMDGYQHNWRWYRYHVDLKSTLINDFMPPCICENWLFKFDQNFRTKKDCLIKNFKPLYSKKHKLRFLSFVLWYIMIFY